MRPQSWQEYDEEDVEEVVGDMDADNNPAGGTVDAVDPPLPAPVVEPEPRAAVSQ